MANRSTVFAPLKDPLAHRSTTPSSKYLTETIENLVDLMLLQFCVGTQELADSLMVSLFHQNSSSSCIYDTG